MKLSLTIWLLTSGLVLGSSASAAPPATADTITYFNGIKVAIDPKTGRMREPTVAEMKALQATVPQSSSLARKAPRNEAEALRTQRKLPGSRGVIIEVPEDRMSTVTATVQPNGRIRISHGDAPEASR